MILTDAVLSGPAPGLHCLHGNQSVDASTTFARERCPLTHGLPWELMMNGPARLTALAKPCSFRSLTSHSRWTFANASGALPL
jgi:hypothetical protein